MLIHHLGVSQSERVVWLMEELGLPYDVKLYARDPSTRLAPPELAEVSPLGAAPVIEDGDVRLAESGAILQYVLARHGGGGRLEIDPASPDYPAFLYWLHYANAGLMPAMMSNLVLAWSGAPPSPVAELMQTRLHRHLDLVDARLADHAHFAGERFTTADIMMHFPLAKMLQFYPVDLSGRPAIAAWRARVEARPAFARAMAACGEAIA